MQRVFAQVFGGVFTLWLSNYAPMVQAAGDAETAARAYAKDYMRPSKLEHPASNAYSQAREDLGRTLFFDPRLSGSKFISCATCHNPAFAWGDGLPKGIGHGMKELGRRSPTILNAAWGQIFFWDGRAETLEDQALGPIQSPGEMNMPLDKMVQAVAGISEYKAMFDKAYPGEAMDEKTVAKAIALFERTVVSGQAPFDKWVAGEKKAISDAAKRGFVVFNDKGRCSKCHSSWRFTDDSFHDIGVSGDDIGRGKILPGVESMQFAFKTPTLRNVDRRFPFMHDGSEANLEAVIAFYDLGGKEKRSTLAEDVKPLNLSSQEKTDLLSFLHTLTSQDKAISVPTMPM